jgi:hypothetical protein
MCRTASYNEWKEQLAVDLNKERTVLTQYLDRLRNLNPLNLAAHCDKFDLNPISHPACQSIAGLLHLDEYRAAEANRRAELHHTAKYALEETFKHLLERRHGLAPSTQTERLWNLAWEYGHMRDLHSNWEDVLNYYDDLAELVKG